ncbi:GNAT family N-acetyltransferase [Paenibacillus kyungheensis]|uniref:GNAT family N-acetyltransferase n=1 Tax=Paenibacillus kyungheensis TaxID=1452732 RepID=A0AAX3LVY3_9BACL|nr:GNAT family N-acetyltransferase [Paenibacillus kyungheensis]WCT53858.1 GNAT family N-acetyltransferase [Paenibacillus kyungheensis]
MENIIVQQIQWNTDQYRACLSLRDEVLRQPLGLSIWDDPWQEEGNDIHICATLEQDTIGVLLLRPIDQQVIQMKQVAVSETVRGKQVGKKLVELAEQIAIAKGYRTIILHARENAIPFYKKLHYSSVGEPFTEVGIKHSKMIKHIQ